MQTEEMPLETAIVGGGLAGLAVAAYLARAGRRVTVFERAAGLGGRAATRSHEGYALNQGIHALYTGGPASRALAELGVTYSAGVPRAPFGLLGGRFYPLPTTPWSLATSGLLSARDRLEVLRVLATLPKQNPRDLGWTPAETWLERSVRQPRARGFFAAFASLFAYSSALDLVSADVVVERLRRTLTHPVHYLDGGWQVLVDGLRARATEAGARVVSGCAATAVACADGRVQGVWTRDGGLVRADAVVLATTPREALKLVHEGAYRPLRTTVEALVPAEVACLDVAVRALPRPDRPVVSDQERPLFLSVQSSYARVAPDGGAVIHAVKALDHRRPADPDEDERDLTRLLDAAQPGWEQHVVRRFFLPRMLASGALPLARSGGLAGRPGPSVPGIQGLLLAGDWIGPEGYLADASLASARQVAHLLMAPRAAARRGLGAEVSSPEPAEMDALLSA